MFYKETFASLNAQGVRYLVVGGVAMNLHGVPRMTYDLDLMLALDAKNIHATWEALSILGFRPRVAVNVSEFSDAERRIELKKTKNMLVLSFFRGDKEFEVIDIFVDNPIEFEHCYLRKQTFTLESVPVQVIGIPDLIEMKKTAGRVQDAEDIDSLNRLLRNDTKD